MPLSQGHAGTVQAGVRELMDRQPIPEPEGEDLIVLIGYERRSHMYGVHDSVFQRRDDKWLGIGGDVALSWDEIANADDGSFIVGTIQPRAFEQGVKVGI